MIVTWRDGGEFVDNTNLPPQDWNYIQRVNSNMWNFYLNKRIAKGASFYINVQNIFNIKYINTFSGYRDSLRFPWSPRPGNDEYGDYDKYWINTFDGGDDWNKWRLPKRNIYLGIRYQF